jgi:hypothetical protein
VEEATLETADDTALLAVLEMTEDIELEAQKGLTLACGQGDFWKYDSWSDGADQ